MSENRADTFLNFLCTLETSVLLQQSSGLFSLLRNTGTWERTYLKNLIVLTSPCSPVLTWSNHLVLP